MQYKKTSYYMSTIDERHRFLNLDEWYNTIQRDKLLHDYNR